MQFELEDINLYLADATYMEDPENADDIAQKTERKQEIEDI